MSDREELASALSEVSDAHFETLSDEVGALEAVHQVLESKLSAAGE